MAQAPASTAERTRTEFNRERVTKNSLLRLLKEKPEPRAAARRGLHFHFAVMKLDDPEHHRQTNPATLFFRREIQVEDPTQVFRRYAHARVFNRYFDAPPPPVAPLRSAATPTGPEATRQVREIIDGTQKMLDGVSSLGTDDRKANFQSAKALLAQAEEALKKDELTLARSFADRANNIAKLLLTGR